MTTMAHFDRYHRNRHVRLGREAVLPFAVGLALVIAGTAFGLVAAAMTGSFAARPAAAAVAAPPPTVAIDATAETIRTCGASAEGAHGLADGGEQKPAFGFLVFDWD